jgi:hypothetical protein
MQEQIVTLAKLGACLALAAVCACGSIESRPPSPSPIQLHIEARGGASAIRSIKAIKLTLDLVEPQFALQADYLANRSNCMRIDIFNNGKYLQSEGVSSDGGWANAAGDISFTPQAEGGTEALLHGVDSPVRMIGLDEFPDRGHKIVYGGRELLESQQYDRVIATYSDGYTAELYLDPTTHLIGKIREHKPMHLAIDPTKLTIETQFSDYRVVSGVMFPFFSREVNWQTGKELGHTTVKSIVVNSADALAVCSRPILPGR